MKWAIAAALAFGSVAHAQQAGNPLPPDEASTPPGGSGPTEIGGRVNYPPNFFARFAPQNAGDMVARVPGFTLNEGEDRRGFSGAAGNVLIDGRRPSTKSQDLSSILARIPAAQVARIELIRDAGSTSDAAGQSVLVNVVRVPSAGSGVWEATLESDTERGRVSPRGEASWSGRNGDFEYTVGASRYYEYRPLTGDRLITNGVGGLLGTRLDETPRTYREGEVNAEARTPVLGGDLTVNGQVNRWNFRTTLDSIGFDALDARTDDFSLAIDERQQSEELGFNFERSLGGADLALIGLATRRHYANDEATTSRDAGGAFLSTVAQSRRNESAETIGRATLSWPLSPAHRMDIGGEIALNSLDANLALTRDTGTGPVPIPIPSANVLVEETRAEAFATFVWRAPQRWTLEATLAGETSTLNQTGDTNLETTFSFIKPSLQLTHQIGARNQIRARVWRDVDQLDFNDFVSAAELADDRVAGGNPNLRPETSWRMEVAADLRFGTDGALMLRAFNWLLSDASDVVPVGPPGMQFDAPGNIGDGWVHGLQATATVPLDRILPGARLTLDATVQEAEVTDPTTHQPRTISGFRESTVDIDFRQDIPERRLAWGVSYYRESEFATYRLNEVEYYVEGPWLDVWVETTAIPGIKVRAFANAVLDSPFRRERQFATPDRTAPFDRIELRERRFGSFFGITVSGTL